MYFLGLEKSMQGLSGVEKEPENKLSKQKTHPTLMTTYMKLY